MRRSSSSSGGNTIFIGKLSSRVREDDLRDEFRRYGRIRDIDFRRHRGFAFVEYNSSSDARAAVNEMDGQRFEDTRIVVQFREGKGDKRQGPSNADLCYNCGRKGHWANECKEGNWSNKCYRCGKSGHLKKDCTKSRTPSSRRDSPKRSRRSGDSKRNEGKNRSASKERSRSRDRKNKRKHSSSKSSSRSNSSSNSKSKSKSKSKSRSPSKSKSKSSRSSSRSSKSRRGASNERRSKSKGNSRSRSPVQQLPIERPTD